MKIFIVTIIAIFASSAFSQDVQKQQPVSSSQVNGTKRTPLILSAGTLAPIPVSSNGTPVGSKLILHANDIPPAPESYRNNKGVMEKIAGAPNANHITVPVVATVPIETSNVSNPAAK